MKTCKSFKAFELKLDKEIGRSLFLGGGGGRINNKSLHVYFFY